MDSWRRLTTTTKLILPLILNFTLLFPTVYVCHDVEYITRIFFINYCLELGKFASYKLPLFKIELNSIL